MSSLFTVFVLLWSLVGSQTSVKHVDGLVRFTDLYGHDRETNAALGCGPGGVPTLWLARSVDLETTVHELGHAYDCIDDGVMNASPIGGARPAKRPSWVSDYCWESDAEWYACWVVRSRSTNASPLDAATAGPPPDALRGLSR